MKSWWHHQGLITRVALLVAALALTAGLGLAVLLNALSEQRSATASARHSREVSTVLEALKLDVLDVETGVRGYVITRQERFLEPYRTARRRIPGDTARLIRLVSSRADQRPDAAAAAAAVQRYLHATAEPLLAAVRAMPHHAVPIAKVARDKGMVDALRAQLERLDRSESTVLAARREAANRSASRAVAVAIAGFAMLGVLLALAAWYMLRAVVRPVRRVAGAAAELAGGDYSARAPATGGGEVLQLADGFNTMAASLADTHLRLEQQNAELEAQRSELVAAVGRLGREKTRIERFLRYGRRVSAETEVEAVAQMIVDELRELAGADRAALYLEDPHEPEAARRIATAGPDEDRAPDAAPGPDERLIRTRPGDAAPALSPAGDELHVPLHTGGRPIGTLVLTRDDGRFTPAAVETVGDLAVQSSVALVSALSLRSARQAASLVRAVLDATPDAIAFHDAAGQVVLENRPMIAVRSELDAHAAEDPDRVAGAPDAPEDEQRDELELAGSRRRFARFAGPVRDAAGILLGRLVALRDITAEREAERVKNEFFGMVSHELRTPLTSIIGYLELVLDDDEETLDPAHRDFLAVAQRNARRLLRLVGDLLFVAQVEAGTLTLEPTSVELATVAAQAVETFAPKAATRRIELITDLQPVPPLLADADRLAQVLENLLANALKFTAPGGRVEVRLRERDGVAVLEVADSGPGIAAADQARLFDRFYRTRKAIDGAVEGVGLGLAIARAIVDGHAGRISVHSTEGAGATFVVELPLVPQPATAGGSSSAGGR